MRIALQFEEIELEMSDVARRQLACARARAGIPEGTDFRRATRLELFEYRHRKAYKVVEALLPRAGSDLVAITRLQEDKVAYGESRYGAVERVGARSVETPEEFGEVVFVQTLYRLRGEAVAVDTDDCDAPKLVVRPTHPVDGLPGSGDAGVYRATASGARLVAC